MITRVIKWLGCRIGSRHDINFGDWRYDARNQRQEREGTCRNCGQRVGEYRPPRKWSEASP